MPFAVTHVLLSILVLDLFRDFVIKHKQNVPLWMVYFGGFAGLMPDLDIPVYWFVRYVLGIHVEWFHRTLTHSFFFALIFLTIAFVLFKRHRTAATVFAITAFGVTFHMFLDYLLTTQIMPFYPFSYYSAGIGLLSNLDGPAIFEGLDAIILVAWLFWQEQKHKIIDFV